ncbi:hypothetical protein [Acidovorax soli]|uniref:hypothetical protein n=1 Tax=Acidovorax soli TaxID=592050 RepID=UPI0032B2D50F
MKKSSFLAMWGWPLALAVLSASGLASALVSDTWGDWWSWLGLGLPVAVMGWHAWPRSRALPAPVAPASHHRCGADNACTPHSTHR